VDICLLRRSLLIDVGLFCRSVLVYMGLAKDDARNNGGEARRLQVYNTNGSKSLLWVSFD